MTLSREYLLVHQVLTAGFVVCRFDLDKKKLSELVRCVVADSDSNLSHSTDDHNIDTTTVLSLSFLGELYEVKKLHQHRLCCSPQLQ